MTDTASSPRNVHHPHHHHHHHSHSRASRPTTTPSARPPNPVGSVGQKMPPLLSPRISNPQNVATPARAKTPSPSYFGFPTGEDNSSLADSQHSKSNWSPPSSAVRSTAAASPSVLPLDQNPDFDAFRKGSEGKAFNLGGLGNDFNHNNMSVPSARSKHGKSASRSDASREVIRDSTSHSLDPSAAELGRSPKRLLSPGSLVLPEEVRRASPASFEKNAPEVKTKESKQDSGNPRLALPFDNNHASSISRAETLPAKSDNIESSSMMVTAQHVVNLMEARTEEVLLLDLRVSTQHAKSHITGALNLCIPTTLLKRPSFNVQKLAETFKDDEQRHRFEKWRNSSYIIVYDASSAVLKDAAICVNTIKKFKIEGYEGTLYIVKGGFEEFARRFPSYVENGAVASANDAAKHGVESDGPEVAPVVGGCPMPSTENPANPFFGNIRQNMDLIGGVGQIPIKHPSKATRSEERQFPQWLQQVSDDRDQGKRASKKFEQIERREKKRMEDALSGQVSYGTPKRQTPGTSTQLAGIEKGNKNRYNNIWPFEHSRVKLQGVPNYGCDYFNGSHIKAAWSNKRYITTQAPIPATFNDFWNVVWQQDVRVVVMLTAEKEGAQVKAHNYWDRKQYGALHLDFLSEKRASIDPSRIHRHRQRPSAVKRQSTGPIAQLDSKEEKAGDHPYVVVRRFTLSHEKYPFEPMREITQLQYSGWPDFGAPQHPAHLLGLVEQCDAVVRASNRTLSGEPDPPNKRPVLVHCSAGCGRTGTFCTVDSVIDMLKRQRISHKSREATPMDVDQPGPKSPTHKSDGGGGFFSPSILENNEGVDGTWVQREDMDLVEKTVEDFRHQRLSMVQSLRQYVLCYESILEWLFEQAQRSN